MRTKFNRPINIRYDVIPSIISESITLNQTEKNILGLLFKHISDTGYCHLKNKQISELINRSIKPITTAISNLKSIGVIVVEYKNCKKGRIRKFKLSDDWIHALVVQEAKHGNRLIPTGRPTGRCRPDIISYNTSYYTHNNIRPRVGASRAPQRHSDFLKQFPQKFRKSKTFVQTWKEWLQDRKDRKKSVTKISAKRQANLLSAYSPQEAIKIIDRSIQNGWTGLFPLDKAANSCQVQAPKRKKYPSNYQFLFDLCLGKCQLPKTADEESKFDSVNAFLKKEYEKVKPKFTERGEYHFPNLHYFTREYVDFVEKLDWVSNYSPKLLMNPNVYSQFYQHMKSNVWFLF